MRLALGLIICAAELFLAASAVAQPAVNQLEQRLQGTAPQPGPGTPAAAADGFLGAEFDEEGGQGRGIPVTRVRPGGPAEKGGLRVDDLITAINGRTVRTVNDYDNIKGPPGMTLRITVDRGGRPESLTVTLGTRPPAAADSNVGEAPAPALTPPATSPPTPSLSPPIGTSPSTAPPPQGIGETAPRGSGIRATPLDLPPPPPSESATAPPTGSSGAGGASLGITVDTFSGQEGAAPGVPVRRGAVITKVRPGSPAELAGLPLRAVIVGVDGKPVTTSDDLVSVIKYARPGQEIELRYYVGGALSQKTVRLAAAGGGSTAAFPAGPDATPRRSDVPFGGPPLRERPAASLPDASASAPGSTPRPLINRVERTDNNIRPPAAGAERFGPSTVYDPQAMAALQKSVAELSAAVSSLEDRLKALEARPGGASPSSTLPPPTPAGPGLGSPSGAGAVP